MKKYILVLWPESQNFMEHEDCVPHEEGALFVPEEVYEAQRFKSGKFENQNSVEVSGIKIFAHNQILELGPGHVSYASNLHETAVVLRGADTIGVAYWVVNGDKRKEVVELVKEYSQEKWSKSGLFGEVVAWACAHPDFNAERSVMGRWNSRCDFKSVKPLLQNGNSNKEP